MFSGNQRLNFWTKNEDFELCGRTRSVTTKELQIPSLLSDVLRLPLFELLAVFLSYRIRVYCEKGINQPFYNFLVMVVVVLKEVAWLKSHSFVHQITIISWYCLIFPARKGNEVGDHHHPKSFALQVKPLGYFEFQHYRFWHFMALAFQKAEKRRSK